ncbi:hypothetical protein JHK87_015300 [Glycine soja]|nr:hypothetical protein JHK87_015300 [Glycine soja]
MERDVHKLDVLKCVECVEVAGCINRDIKGMRLLPSRVHHLGMCSLIREGFSPSTIEETTDISSIDQNRLIVGAQVSDSLVHSKADLNLAQAPLRDSPP